MYDTAIGTDVQLTQGQVRDTSPTFSPDGEKLAFVRNGSTIPILDLGTGMVDLIAEQKGKCSALKWSPDGARFAFVGDWTGTQQVYTMNADGTGLKRLTQRSAVEISPYWLPDSKQVAFISTSSWLSRTSSIYTATVTGEPSVSEVLNRWCEDKDTEHSCESFLSVAWSPDGETVAIVTQSRGWGFVPPPEGRPRTIGEHEGIGVVVLGQDSPILVAQTVVGGFGSLSWSPDGGRLLYHSDCACGFEDIRFVDVATREEQRLIGVLEETGHVMADPAWSPDGKVIVYSRASCAP